MLLLVFPQEISSSEIWLFLNIVSNIIQYVPKCFRQHSEIIIKLARLLQQLRKKRLWISQFFLFLKKIHLPTYIFSLKIRIFNSGLVSNKNILSISIFNNVMRFQICTISVHCAFVHCRSWTQCDHSSLPCVVDRMRSHSDLSLRRNRSVFKDASGLVMPSDAVQTIAALGGGGGDFIYGVWPAVHTNIYIGTSAS